MKVTSYERRDSLTKFFVMSRGYLVHCPQGHRRSSAQLWIAACHARHSQRGKVPRVEGVSTHDEPALQITLTQFASISFPSDRKFYAERDNRIQISPDKSMAIAAP